MSTNRISDCKVGKKIEKFFDKSVINSIGRSSGFWVRKIQKISPYHFVLGFILSCCNNKNTFGEWATQISLQSKKKVSKQAVFERINEKATVFSKQLLEETLLKKCNAVAYQANLFSFFGKALLQDSTNLRLPQSLSGFFPGNRSGGQQKAIARIQSMLDIKAMRFINFSLGSFTQNDQSASSDIIAEVKKGDLVIRDLGYFCMDVFEKFIKKKVFILSRLRYGVTISDLQGNPISLKDLLKQKAGTDRWVYIGSKKKIKMRLIMLPVPAAQANEKIRKAKQDRDARLNHSKDYYAWLKYNVYITTVDKSIWTVKQVYQAYNVRWQIEIIFKSWKTGFNLQKVLHRGCTNVHRVRVIIYLMLLFLTLFMQKIYVYYKNIIEKEKDKKVSLLKLSMYISDHLIEILMLPHKISIQLIKLHCCYDKRFDRVNMTDLFNK